MESKYWENKNKSLVWSHLQFFFRSLHISKYESGARCLKCLGRGSAGGKQSPDNTAPSEGGWRGTFGFSEHTTYSEH